MKFTIDFGEAINVSTFTTSDITQVGDASSPVWSISDTGDHQVFDLNVTSVSSNGTIIPIIVAGRVMDLVGNSNTLSGGVDNSVTFIDLTGPSVTVEQAASQVDPTGTLPIRFTITFSEKINPATFTNADITQNGTAPGLVWGLSSTDNKVFTLTAIVASGYGTLIPSIDAGKVMDISGNWNFSSTSTDNSVTYVYTPPPPQRAVFRSVGAYDGHILELNESSQTGWLVDLASTTFNLGDGLGDRQYRALCHSIHPPCPITRSSRASCSRSAGREWLGTDPFTILGLLGADIRKNYFGSSISLVASDFQAAPNIRGVAVFRPVPVNKWYVAVLRAAGYPFINKVGTTQFRLYFNLDDNDDMGDDFMRFFSGNYPTANVRPTLVITYTVP